MAKSKLRSAAAPAKSDKTRVLIVDDHQLVRVGVSTMLQAEPDLEVCGDAADESAALRRIRKDCPDLAIVDISLDEGNGLDLIKRIKSTQPSMRIIVLSMHDEALFAGRALSAGAVGYVPKQAPARTIITAIRRVLNGGIYLSEEMTSRFLHRVSGANDKKPSSAVESLSDREFDFFQRIGQGVAISEIAEQLHLSPKTVATYRDRIRQKLDVGSAAELSRIALMWLLENA